MPVDFASVPSSLDGFFLIQIGQDEMYKNRIYRDSYVTCKVSPGYEIGQHEATKMFS